MKLMSFITIMLTFVNVYAADDSKYLVIQNVATEKTRVYERCFDYPGCPHRMIYETEMVVGKDDGDTRTLLGVYNITKWVKFYEDGNRNYPSWYNPAYPPVPPPGVKGTKWFKEKYMPGGKGEMRGAFGWYTALVEPNAFGQWMHGTIGWGADGDRYIDRAHKTGFTSWFVDLRSHGCTRHENGAIAYLQAIVPAGTPLIKVYALEKLTDASLSRYQDQKQPIKFDYILTKDQVKGSHPDSIDANTVMNKMMSGLIAQNDILEKGSYMADQYPTVQPINKDEKSKSGKSGNAYKLKLSRLRGVYNVDTGTFADYVHPSELNVGGDQTLLKLPTYVVQ